MTGTPLFSIVIPVYNTDFYLDKSVPSAIRQTMKNIEIILVDDGSTDASPQICDQYASQDSRVKVIHKKNGGLSDARNVGIRHAAGEYILFLDSDDYLEENTCELFGLAAELGCDLLAGNRVKPKDNPDLINRSAEIKKWDTRTYMKHKMRTGHLEMPAWIYLYRRSFLLENNLEFKFGILHEDEEFTPRALLASQSIAVTNIVFYHYIQREGSITRRKDLRKNAQDLYDTCVALEKRYQTLADTELSRLLRDSLSMKTLSLFQEGRLYQYGSEYIHKEFVLRNAFKRKTRCKAYLFCTSPKLYWHINHFTKSLK